MLSLFGKDKKTLLRPTRFALAFLLVLVPFLVLVNANWRLLVGSDFLNYFVAAKIISRGEGAYIYSSDINRSVQDELLKDTDWKNILVFRSLPTSALVFLPLTGMSVATAYRTFAVVNFTLLILIAFLALRVFMGKNAGNSFVTFVPFVFLPIIFSLQMGQISILLTLFLMVIYINLKKKKWLWLGFFSCLLFLKPQYLIAVPFFLILAKNKRKFMLGFLSLFLVLISLSIFIVGWSNFLHYPSYLINSEGAESGSKAAEIFTLYAALKILPLTKILDPFLLLSLNAIFYLLALILFFRNSEKIGLDNSFISLTLFTIFFSVHSLAYDLSLLLIPLFILISRFSGKGDFRLNSDLFSAFLIFTIPATTFLGTTLFTQFFLLALGFYYLKSYA